MIIFLTKKFVILGFFTLFFGSGCVVDFLFLEEVDEIAAFCSKKIKRNLLINHSAFVSRWSCNLQSLVHD